MQELEEATHELCLPLVCGLEDRIPGVVHHAVLSNEQETVKER